MIYNELTWSGPDTTPPAGDVLDSLGRTDTPAILLAAPDWSAIQFVNAGFDHLFGTHLATDDADADHLVDAVHPDHRDRVSTAMTRAANGEEIAVTCRVNPQTEHDTWAHISLTPIETTEDTDPRIVCTALDTTHVHEWGTESSVASAVVDQAKDGVAIFAPDTTVEYVNHRVSTMLSQPVSDLVGMDLDDLASIGAFDDAEIDVVADAITAIVAGDATETKLELHPDHPGTDDVYELRLSPLDIGEDRPRVLGISRNVSIRADYERTAEQVAEAVQGLDAAETKSAVADVTVDIATDILEQPLTTVFLYEADADVLTPVAASDGTDPPAFEPGTGIVGDVYATDTRTVLDDASQDPRTLPYGSTMLRGYTVLPLGDHGVLAFASPTEGTLDSAALKLAEILAANTETALDRVEREQRLRDNEATLRRQNRRLDEFTSIVSHDLRNPVTVATGHAELLADSVGDHHHLEELTAALDRMDDLVEDLLALAKSGEDIDDREWVPLQPAVQTCWSTVATKDATLHCNTTVSVYGNRFRLRQLFENLIGNAIQHGGSDVTVEVGDLEDGFYIADTGPGIPDHIESTLFDPGVSTEPDGTGYGLNIVAAVVDAHDWAIEAVDTEDGARFDITGVDTRPTES